MHRLIIHELQVFENVAGVQRGAQDGEDAVMSEMGNGATIRAMTDDIPEDPDVILTSSQ
jgi:hypothetical protein